MAQLQRMDAHLYTLSTELYKVKVHVGRIARRQATMGGFAPETTPSPPSIDSNSNSDSNSDSDSDYDDDDGDDDDASEDGDDDGDASSTDDMST